MKRVLLSFIALLGYVCAYSQTPLNNRFLEIDTLICPFDTTQEVTWPTHWMIYQTTNSLWNGPIDSSRCINAYYEAANNYTSIALNQIDPSKPIFIRSLEQENAETPLLNNAVYAATTRFDIFPNIDCETGTDCEDGFCTGIFIGIDIPNADSTGRALREYPLPITSFSSYNEYCVVTEYFEDSYIKEFIIKVTLSNNNVSDEKLRLFSSYIYTEEPFHKFTELVAPGSLFNGIAYEGYIYEFIPDVEPYFHSAYIGMHNTSYPSDSNITFIEARPEINSDLQETFNVWLDYVPPLHLQPFTALRGALVEGSDSIRHILNLIVNDNMNWCVGSLVELIISDGGHIFSQGGSIDFSGATSCFRFENGGSFDIAPGSTMYFGVGGNGMMALVDGGNIQLHEHSQLYFDNKMLLLDFSRAPENQAYLHLPPGSSFTFGENASLQVYGYQDGYIKLNVLMEGGELDDSNLTPEERLLINRIYPTQSPAIADNLKLLQNPVSSYMDISYIAADEKKMDAIIYTSDGRLVSQHSFALTKGYNLLEYPVTQLNPGVYILVASVGGKRVSKKVVIL